MVPGRGMRYLIIANPTAGRRGTVDYARGIQRLLQEGGTDSAVEFTTRRGDAESIAANALRRSLGDSGRLLCVVACGGDGTIQEVVNAILHHHMLHKISTLAPSGSPGFPKSECVLGLAPAGRCNDFASAFGIRCDAEQVASILLTRCARPVDVGRVNDRFFCTVAALGFDAAVSRYVNDMWMPLRGTIAYVYGALRTLMFYRPAELGIVSDDVTVEGPLFLVASANTSSYGGQMHIAPQASPLDGMLDICLVSVLSRLRALRLIRRVIRGGHAGLPEVRLLRTRSLRIESRGRQEIWADGELVGETPATIEVVPQAVRVLVPQASL